MDSTRLFLCGLTNPPRHANREEKNNLARWTAQSAPAKRTRRLHMQRIRPRTQHGKMMLRLPVMGVAEARAKSAQRRPARPAVCFPQTFVNCRACEDGVPHSARVTMQNWYMHAHLRGLSSIVRARSSVSSQLRQRAARTLAEMTLPVCQNIHAGSDEPTHGALISRCSRGDLGELSMRALI